jgi:hypothetical protein
MSYDIELREPASGAVLQLDEPHQMKGGTYQMGGCLRAEFNITYNYSLHLDRVLPAREPDEKHHHMAQEDGKLHSIRAIYGLTGAESIPILRAAIDQLADDVDDDYWQPSEGNVKGALCEVLALAQLRPDGVWTGD